MVTMTNEKITTKARKGTKKQKKQRQPLNLMRLVPWMLTMSFFSMLLALYLISSIVQQEGAKVQANLATVEAQLQAEPQVDPEEEALRQQLLDLQTQINEISTMATTITTGYINWPQLTAFLNNYDHNQMSITGLTYAEQTITLTGQAAEEPLVIVYGELLEAAGVFKQVTVRSITLNDDEEAAFRVEFSLLIELGDPTDE